MKTKELAKEIANKMGMSYCWEDIMYRLEHRIQLPFKVVD